MNKATELNASTKIVNDRRRVQAPATVTQSASFSIIQAAKPNSLESYSSSVSSNSCHLSASESISSKSANLIFIPLTDQKSTQEDKNTSSKSSSSSSSSVFAGLSVLSFSESNSIPSLSSSISYSDATEIDNNNALINRPLIDLKKQFNSSSFSSTSSLEQQQMSLNADMVSELIAPYRNKPFYGKEWLYAKLNDYLITKKLNYNEESLNASMSTSSGLSSYLQSSSSSSSSSYNSIQTSSCLVLLGDSGTGKTHLCCELKWPVNSNNSDVLSINKQLSSVYFLNWFNSKQNYVKQFSSHLFKSIQELVSNETTSNIEFKKNFNLKLADYLYHDESDYELGNENDFSEEYVSKVADEFIENILKPLNSIKSNLNKYILIDGIDDAILQSERLIPSKSFSQGLLYPFNKDIETKLTSADMLLMFISKTFASFPNWLNIIITSNRSNEKNYLKKYLKYEKIAMDKCVNVDSLISASVLSNKKSESSINSIPISSSMSDPFESKTDLVHSSNSSHSISSYNSKLNSNLSDPVELFNAAHFANLKDIQTYILKRLDNDLILKKKFNKSNAVELFNLLLIKSNFCVLYVEKVLDLVMKDFIISNEIKNIPATLNGLYLYLIESILSKQTNEQDQPNKKDLLYSILSVCLLEPAPFDKLNTFKRIESRYLNLSFKYYENLFDLITPILFSDNYLRQKSPENRLVLFHSSLVDWLTDIKFCSSNYLLDLNEAHLTLSFYYLNHLKSSKETNSNLNWSKFKYHLLNSDSVMCESSLKYFYLLCESDFELNVILENLDEKFLQCKKLLQSTEDLIDYTKIFNNDSFLPKTFSNDEIISEITNENIQVILFDLITKSDLKAIKKMIKSNPGLENRLITMTDTFNQTALLVAVKLNNFEIVEFLTEIPNVNLDHCDNSGWTSLRYSSWMGNENVVNILLENGASVDACDTEERTALRAAVFSGHEHIVKLLLNYNANVNKCDTDNRSVLHVAVYMGHISLVNLLLANGALVNQQDSLGRGILSTVLFSTVSNTQLQLDITETLIKYNADLNQLDNENKTPIILGVLENNIHFVDLLIENNADMDAIDNDGYTAITYAVKNNYFNLVDLFLKKNAATHILDKEGRSILSIACSVGAKEVLRLLMDRGLDEMHRDNFGWTPLHEAAYVGYLDIAQMLINYGSEIDACDNDGKTGLFYACQEGNFELVKLFVNNYADVNIKSHQGMTPFRVACLENRIQICEYLIQTKVVDINYLDPDGRTTLYCLICSSNKNIEMIMFLLENGALVDTIDSDGRTCLHVAATLGDLDIFSLLVKYNSNLESIDNNGSTSLLTATWNDKLDIVKFLLNENICRIDHQDNQGATALSIASQKGNYDIVNELLQHGAQIYASSRNPIKLAHQSGHNEIVKLLQQWSTMCYDLNRLKEETKKSSNTCVPRNSKSVESFRINKSARNANEKFVQNFTNQRCVATPTTFSSYIKCNPGQDQTKNSSSSCRIPTSISASPGTYDYAKIEDLNNRFLNKNNMLNNLDECYEDSINTPINEELKSSRFKQVKEKFLRKSSTLIVSNPSLSSRTQKPAEQIESPTTPGNKSVASFRLFISSLNGSNENQKRSPKFDQESNNQSSYLPMSASSSKLKSSKSITNNTFVQMIRKKLKFLKSPSNSFSSNYNYSHQNIDDLNQNDPIIVNGKQTKIHRSVTDTIAASNCYIGVNNQPTNDTLTNSISFIKNKQTVDDDVAHIFNRNSLNDCLNPRCSYRECDSSSIKKKASTNYSSYMLINSNNPNTNGINSVGGTSSSSSSSSNTSSDYYNKNNIAQNQHKRPNCLPLNYFKKETSI